MKIVHLLTAAAIVSLLGSTAALAHKHARHQSRHDKIDAAIAAEFGPPTAAARAAALKPAALTPAERQELQAWMRAALDKGLVPISQTDPNDLRGLDLFNRALGRPPRSALLKTLSDAGVAGPEPSKCDAFLKQHLANGIFLDVGFYGDPKKDLLTATTLQATAGAASIRNFGTNLGVFDSEGNEVTHGSGLSPRGAPTLVTGAPPREGKVEQNEGPMSLAEFTVFMQDGTPCPFRKVVAITPPPQSMAVTAPNNSQNRTTVLCLNRGRPEPGWPNPCDFGPFPQATLDPVKVVVPLAGAITMPNTIALKDNKPDAVLQVTAINSQNGTTCQGQDNDLGPQVLAQTTVSNQKTLNWSILADKALIFGTACYQPHSGLAFNMFWQVKTISSTGTPQLIQAIVSNTLEQGSANTLIVRPVDLQWGCLPGGTLVTLADHSRKPIEDIMPTDLVLGPDGKPWQVSQHIKGDDAELIEVTSEDGAVARMTSEHPVIAGRDRHGRLRWTVASRLAVGMTLITAKGHSRVKSIKHLAYGGAVYNMALKKIGADKVPARGSAFYADGLLVGDLTMQSLPAPVPNAVAAITPLVQAK